MRLRSQDQIALPVSLRQLVPCALLAGLVIFVLVARILRQSVSMQTAHLEATIKKLANASMDLEGNAASAWTALGQLASKANTWTDARAHLQACAKRVATVMLDFTERVAS